MTDTLNDLKPLLVLSAAAILATCLIELCGGGEFFRPYFGGMLAAAAVFFVSTMGIGAMWFLTARGWFTLRGGGRHGILVSVLLATLLAAGAIGVDLGVGIQVANVPPPWSLAFYPVMALVAEIVFHVLPLALLLFGANALGLSKDVSIWSAMALASLIEPTFQVVAGSGGGWLATYVWAQVWAVNASQLFVFRRFGFVAMYVVRIVYYLHWHIVWGVLRLPN